MRRLIGLARFQIAWWRWWFSCPPPPIEIYTGPGKLCREDRLLIWERRDAEWEALEPKEPM